MERAIQLLAVVNFFVIGLSHIAQPRAWVEFFTWLRERGDAGVFANGFVSLGFGSLVVGFHEVWTGIPVILTVYGWCLVLKSFIAFVFPALSMRGMQRVSPDREWEFRVPGTVFLVIGGLLLYEILAAGN